MCEGRRHPQMTTRTLGLPDMPPQFKQDVGIFKAVGMSGHPPTFDHNKNNLSLKEPTSLVSVTGVRQPATTTTHHPPPFTASWLTEVARMTPLRPPERHPFSGPINSPSVASFYQHYQSLSPRTPFYAPHPFLNPPHYLRNFAHPQQIQGFSHSGESGSDFARSPAGLTSTFMRPLGPPLRPSIDMTRDLLEKNNLDLPNQREFSDIPLQSRPLQLTAVPTPLSDPSRTSSKDIHQSEPSSKKRFIQSTAIASPSRPSSSPSTRAPEPSNSPTPCTSSQEISPNSLTASSQLEDDSSSPYHPHFCKGSLVMVGENVIKKVEDLQTSDFFEASQATLELVLDPSTVGAITMDTERNIANITFKFNSRNKEISVDASDDHPFFVFHKGWSSCNPERTMQKYKLSVRQLVVDDVCVSLQRKACDEQISQEATTVMPPPKTLPKIVHNVATSLTPSDHSQLSGKLVQYPSFSTAQNVSKDTSLPFEYCSGTAKTLPSEDLSNKLRGVPCRPSSTTYEKQKSSDDSQNRSKNSRKRRWSDPEH